MLNTVNLQETIIILIHSASREIRLNALLKDSLVLWPIQVLYAWYRKLLQSADLVKGP